MTGDEDGTYRPAHVRLPARFWYVQAISYQSTSQPSELRHVWASLIIILKESSSYKRFTLFNHILIYPF